MKVTIKRYNGQTDETYSGTQAGIVESISRDYIWHKSDSKPDWEDAVSAGDSLQEWIASTVDAPRKHVIINEQQ